ncbi:uncharacterized protein LOC133034580 [Cannabis sativa]|uniref:uncharacterized protein LOC133034580 n=1 Tax=Cannabis sativa TaxID=3483 RepID=UPI0029C9BF1C|nr:uncharacterized protein LOC133034580 [Cannabis sativa]
MVDVGAGAATFSNWLLGIFGRGHEGEMEEVVVIKVNVNGDLFEQEGRFGMGCVARNRHGAIVEAFKKGKIGCVQLEIAEIIGIKEALSWIATHSWNRVIMETDSLVCVQAIHSGIFMPSQFGLIIQDVRNLLMALSFVDLCFVKRSANKLAHCLTRDSYFSTGRILQLEDCSSEVTRRVGNEERIDIQRIRELLGLSSPEGNINYLGLPLFRAKHKDADFNFILDNLTTKLHGWKAKTLSKAGRATLIKSVGLALPLYDMQTTKLSNRLARKIDGMVRDFWWGSEKGNRGIHLKAWDKLCLPKSLGGLGFRKSKEMNQAFLAKWGWNLLTGNQSLCCRILEAKYLKGKSFLDCVPKASDSWFWKNVTKSRDVIRKGACKRVVDGQDTNIWLDPWIAHLKGFTPQPSGRVVSRETKVAELLLQNGGWNFQKLHQLFNQETISAILSECVPTGRGKDSWVWTLESNGRFTCKSAYLAQTVDSSSPTEALPVRSVLGRRFPIEDESCPLCGAESETMEHLFLSCNVAFHLWRSSPWGIFPICDAGIRMWDWVKFLWDLKNKGINEQKTFLYASLIIDTIWRTRNEKHVLTAGGSEDHVGKVIWVSAKRLDFSSALCGEAAACCLAIEEVKARGIQYLIVESDLRVVINVLNGKESRWGLDNYVSFCKTTSTSFIGCNFHFVRRQCNFMAHNVANWAFSNQRFGSMPISSLPEIIFCNDREV